MLTRICIISHLYYLVYYLGYLFQNILKCDLKYEYEYEISKLIKLRTYIYYCLKI